MALKQEFRPKAGSYAERLKDPRWQRRRLEVMERAEFRCENCQATDQTLHAHHRIYIKGRAPCEECHRQWHEERAELDDALKYLTPGEFGLVAAYARQLLQENHPFFSRALQAEN